MNYPVLSLNLLLYLLEDCRGKVARIVRVLGRRSIWIHPLEGETVLYPLRLLRQDAESVNLVDRYNGERQGQFSFSLLRT